MLVRFSTFCFFCPSVLIEILKNNLKIKTIKIPSGEITNFKLISDLKGCSVILSTGMSTLKEIAEAINEIFKKEIFSTKNKIKILNYNIHKKIYNKIIILHCVSDYPVKDNFVNLLAINQLKNIHPIRDSIGFVHGSTVHAAGYYFY